jgi:hypothetical protein
VQNAALEQKFKETQAYPYSLQELGKHAWDAAGKSAVTWHDFERATGSAIAALDESYNGAWRPPAQIERHR